MYFKFIYITFVYPKDPKGLFKGCFKALRFPDAIPTPRLALGWLL